MVVPTEVWGRWEKHGERLNGSERGLFSATIGTPRVTYTLSTDVPHLSQLPRPLLSAPVSVHCSHSFPMVPGFAWSMGRYVIFPAATHLSFQPFLPKRTPGTPQLHPSRSPLNSIGVMLAQPSSSHHRSHGERSDRERSSHRHHRSISSTTLLLVLSLILAILAVMLSLPSQHASTPSSPATHPAVPNPEPTINEDTSLPKGLRPSPSTNAMLLNVRRRLPVVKLKFLLVLPAALFRPRLVPPVSPQPLPG